LPEVRLLGMLSRRGEPGTLQISLYTSFDVLQALAVRLKIAIAMAIYKYDKFLSKSDHNAFDAIHDPGVAAPYAGIYRCTGCGKEIASAKTHALPPQNHHQHNASQGKIRWQLVVTHAS
jgi:hypothetical protein